MIKGSEIVPGLISCSDSCPIIAAFLARGGAVASRNEELLNALAYEALDHGFALRAPHGNDVDKKANNICQHPIHNGTGDQQGICFLKK